MRAAIVYESGVNPDGRYRMRDAAARDLTQFACLGTLADGIVVSARQDMPMYLDMYMDGRLDLDSLVSRRYALGDINQAIADLDAGRIHGRGVFEISA
jgi:Zn-dependent alcohol dehydrogenase